VAKESTEKREHISHFGVAKRFAMLKRNSRKRTQRNQKGSEAAPTSAFPSATWERGKLAG
jgi:hypothetical protein